MDPRSNRSVPRWGWTRWNEGEAEQDPNPYDELLSKNELLGTNEAADNQEHHHVPPKKDGILRFAQRLQADSEGRDRYDKKLSNVAGESLYELLKTGQGSIDLSEYLGHGALGCEVDGGVMAVVPPTYDEDKWEVRYAKKAKSETDDPQRYVAFGDKDPSPQDPSAVHAANAETDNLGSIDDWEPLPPEPPEGYWPSFGDEKQGDPQKNALDDDEPEGDDPYGFRGDFWRSEGEPEQSFEDEPDEFEEDDSNWESSLEVGPEVDELDELGGHSWIVEDSAEDPPPSYVDSSDAIDTHHVANDIEREPIASGNAVTEPTGAMDERGHDRSNSYIRWMIKQDVDEFLGAKHHTGNITADDVEKICKTHTGIGMVAQGDDDNSIPGGMLYDMKRDGFDIRHMAANSASLVHSMLDRLAGKMSKRRHNLSISVDKDHAETWLPVLAKWKNPQTGEGFDFNKRTGVTDDGYTLTHSVKTPNVWGYSKSGVAQQVIRHMKSRYAETSIGGRVVDAMKTRYSKQRNAKVGDRRPSKDGSGVLVATKTPKGIRWQRMRNAYGKSVQFDDVESLIPKDEVAASVVKQLLGMYYTEGSN